MKKAVRLLEAGLFVFLSLPLAVLPLRWSLEAGQFLGLLVLPLEEQEKDRNREGLEVERVWIV
jgi:hypothetical protein